MQSLSNFDIVSCQCDGRDDRAVWTCDYVLFHSIVYIHLSLLVCVRGLVCAHITNTQNIFLFLKPLRRLDVIRYYIRVRIIWYFVCSPYQIQLKIFNKWNRQSIFSLVFAIAAPALFWLEEQWIRETEYETNEIIIILRLVIHFSFFPFVVVDGPPPPPLLHISLDFKIGCLQLRREMRARLIVFFFQFFIRFICGIYLWVDWFEIECDSMHCWFLVFGFFRYLLLSLFSISASGRFGILFTLFIIY